MFAQKLAPSLNCSQGNLLTLGPLWHHKNDVLHANLRDHLPKKSLLKQRLIRYTSLHLQISIYSVIFEPI